MQLLAEKNVQPTCLTHCNGCSQPLAPWTIVHTGCNNGTDKAVRVYHLFHLECIKKALDERPGCPLDRNRVTELFRGVKMDDPHTTCPICTDPIDKGSGNAFVLQSSDRRWYHESCFPKNLSLSKKICIDNLPLPKIRIWAEGEQPHHDDDQRASEVLALLLAAQEGMPQDAIQEDVSQDAIMEHHLQQARRHRQIDDEEVNNRIANQRYLNGLEELIVGLLIGIIIGSGFISIFNGVFFGLSDPLLLLISLPFYVACICVLYNWLRAMCPI